MLKSGIEKFIILEFKDFEKITPISPPSYPQVINLKLIGYIKKYKK